MELGIYEVGQIPAGSLVIIIVTDCSQIFTYLGPADLLRLLLVCQCLRRLLSSKAALYTWRAARENAGLPTLLPHGIAEIDYATLLFRPYCSVRLSSALRNKYVYLEH